MDNVREQLLARARAAFGDIGPTSSRTSLEDCFTVVGSKVILWFNDTKGNTRAIVGYRPRERAARPA